MRINIIALATLMFFSATFAVADPFVWTTGPVQKNQAEVWRVERVDGNQWWAGTENWSGYNFKSLDWTCGDELGHGCGTSLAISHTIQNGHNDCKVVVAADALRYAYVEVIGLDKNKVFVPGSNMEFGGPKHGAEDFPQILGGWYTPPQGVVKVLLLVTATGKDMEGRANVQNAKMLLACQ